MADNGVGHVPTHPSLNNEVTSGELLLRLNLSLTFFVCGLTLWSRILHKRGIPLFTLIDYDPGSRSIASLHAQLFRLSSVLLANLAWPLLLELVLHLAGVSSVPWVVFRLPAVAVAALLIFSPVDVRLQPRAGNAQALQSLLRCLATRMASKGHGKFGDLLLADSLVSLSRVLYEFGCLATRAIGANDWIFDHSVSGLVIFSVITAWPLIIRARQCWGDWNDDRRDPTQLYNMCKYMTSMAAVSVARMINFYRPSAANAQDAGFTTLLVTWRIVALVAALFSFYWDVAKDWGLELFDHSTWKRTGGFRRQLLLGPPAMYAALIAFDLAARYPWVVPGDPYFDTIKDWTTYIAVLLEVVRRLVWCGFRVEWEFLKRGGPGEDPAAGGIILP